MEGGPDWELRVASDHVYYGQAEAAFHFAGQAASNPARQTGWEGADYDGRITPSTFRQLGFNCIDWGSGADTDACDLQAPGLEGAFRLRCAAQRHLISAFLLPGKKVLDGCGRHEEVELDVLPGAREALQLLDQLSACRCLMGNNEIVRHFRLPDYQR